MGLLGLLAAAVGTVLGAAPPGVGVEMRSDRYIVGDVTLFAAGDGVYAGAKGAVIIATGADGVRASGSTRLHGQRMLGSCQMASDQHSERCAFDMGGKTVTALDRLDRGAWERRYYDGQTIRIQLGGGRPVPVPIALGR